VCLLKCFYGFNSYLVLFSSLRRKHGIPDSDHRPFNVAWAAARTAREDQEREDTRIARAGPASVSSHEPRASQPEHLRHRPGICVTRYTPPARFSNILPVLVGSQRNSTYSTPVPGIPGRFNPSSMDSYDSIPSMSSSHLNLYVLAPLRVLTRKLTFRSFTAQ